MKKMASAVILAVGLVMAAVSYPSGQEAKTEVKATPLSEVEQLKVKNLNLERVILERQIEDWRVKQATLKAEIEKTRPGFVWDPTTGDFKAAK